MSKSDSGIIASQLRVRGALRGGASIRIEGEFEGDIDIAGNVEVGASGRLSGPVKARDITVEGLVTGNVFAERQVVLREGGVLQGDVRATSLSIEEGASISGMVDMIFDGAQPPDGTLPVDGARPLDIARPLDVARRGQP